jgi:hypothetical protein
VKENRLLPSLRLAVVVAALFPTSASAAVTTTTITTPAGPVAYRLYEPADVKNIDALEVTGVSDGRPEDTVDLMCDRTLVAKALPVRDDGSFAGKAGLKAFPRVPCVLRAMPAGTKDFDPFRGPVVVVSYFNGDEYRTAVRGSEVTEPYDYLAATAHRRGRAELHSAVGGLNRDVWTIGAALRTLGKGGRGPVEVDGREAFVSAGVPRGGERDEAPAGFEGVRATAVLDETSGALTVRESSPVQRCADDACLSVVDTGVVFERTIAFTHEHAVADVADRWLSTDGAPHRLRVVYTQGTGEVEKPLWRLPGTPLFASRDFPDVFGPGTLFLNDGAAYGALDVSPPPASSVFADPRRVISVHQLTTPAVVRQTFETGDQVIATDPPAPGAGEESGGGPPPHVIEDRKQPDGGGVRRCKVPRVRAGATVKSARAALKKAGCKTARTTRKARSRTIRRGRVVSLSQRAGKSIPIDTAVTIKVSSGRRKR